jgi:DNA-binding transcriptional MerR regulator
MHKIGEVAELAKVSIRLLRHFNFDTYNVW